MDEDCLLQQKSFYFMQKTSLRTVSKGMRIDYRQDSNYK